MLGPVRRLLDAGTSEPVGPGTTHPHSAEKRHRQEKEEVTGAVQPQEDVRGGERTSEPRVEGSNPGGGDILSNNVQLSGQWAGDTAHDQDLLVAFILTYFLSCSIASFHDQL